MTHDHRVDFQRASHVLANAIHISSSNNPSDKVVQHRGAMSMHRVSEHREEDEDDEETAAKKRAASRQGAEDI